MDSFDIDRTSLNLEESGQGDRWKVLERVLGDVSVLLDVNEDLTSIQKAEEVVLKKEEARGVVFDQLQEELRVLSARLQEAAAAAQRPSGTPSAAEHEAQVRALEQRQYASGKALNDEQALVAKKEVELGRVKAEREEVRKWDPTSGDGPDSTVLRLKMFENLGFKLVQTNPTKIIVRNDSRPDVSVHTADMANRVRSANALWESAS